MLTKKIIKEGRIADLERLASDQEYGDRILEEYFSEFVQQ